MNTEIQSWKRPWPMHKAFSSKTAARETTKISAVKLIRASATKAAIQQQAEAIGKIHAHARRSLSFFVVVSHSTMHTLSLTLHYGSCTINGSNCLLFLSFFSLKRFYFYFITLE